MENPELKSMTCPNVNCPSRLFDHPQSTWAIFFDPGEDEIVIQCLGCGATTTTQDCVSFEGVDVEAYVEEY